MKIKKGGKVINLTEGDIKKLAKSLLTERVSKLIQPGDTWCDIICKRKIAANGSNGDIVKHIQHALALGTPAYGPYNKDNQGGGMIAGCSKNWKTCDGKFRTHTKDAVKEFQDDFDLTSDGIVGLNTLDVLCEYGFDLPKEACEDDCNCDRDDQPIDGPSDDIDIDDDYSSQKCNHILRCIDKINKVPVGRYGRVTDKWALFLNCIRWE